jgi:prephenate dehydratase
MPHAGLPGVGYLGPAGTFSEEALLSSACVDAVDPVAFATIYDTVIAVRDGSVRWAVVPIENSLDGSVTVTLDLLAETGIRAAGACPPGSADEHGELEIVGEVLLKVRHALIAAEALPLGEIDTVLSHPQVPGQCAGFLRGELAHAQVLPASSTAEAVRLVSTAGGRGQAALGTRLAAEIYGGTVIRDGVQDRDDNVTRFVWLARVGDGPAGGGGAEAGAGPEAPPGAANPADARDGGGPPRGSSAERLPPLRADARGGGGWKTSLVFWGPGAERPGWLVRCLDEFARRSINLTKIESRPRRAALGHYMFFVDTEGSVRDPLVAEALTGLRAVCEHVRVLGSYQSA